MLRDVAIAGIGRTAYTRASGRTPLAMAAEAARAAVADAGLTAADVDGVTCFQANDSAGALQVAHAIGCDEVAWTSDVFGGGNVVIGTVAAAASMIMTGVCDTVVVYRSLNGRTGHRFGHTNNRPAYGGELQFSAPHGYMVPPQWLAMWARRYMHEYGVGHEALGQVAVTQRRHAEMNEHAVNRRPLSMDSYLDSRWINEPFRLHDCCLEVDGASAIVMTTLERARDLAKPPIVVRGWAESHGANGSWDQWSDLTQMYSAHAAPKLWARTGYSPSDIDIACMYDCFTYTVLATIEDYGFCARGEAGDWFAEGRGTFGGDVVVNSHGGLLSEGYIHGMNHHFEAVVQLRGEAGSRQSKNHDVALVTGGAGAEGGAIVYTVDA